MDRRKAVKTANGLTIPDAILATADTVIE